MNWDWPTIREQSKKGFTWASQVALFLQVVFYLFACTMAGTPVKPRDYIAFAHYCAQWRPGPVLNASAERGLR